MEQRHVAAEPVSRAIRWRYRSAVHAARMLSSIARYEEQAQGHGLSDRQARGGLSVERPAPGWGRHPDPG